jgi:hypothetical protein
MRTAVAVGLTTPHERAADRVLATLLPVAERCVSAGWSLWLRAWPARQASDAWVLLAALLERAPRLGVGVVASFPPATRVSDVEDLLVIDNLSGGRVELAFAPDAAPEAIAEVVTALRGEALSRPDADGIQRSFRLTPRAARGTVPTWRLEGDDARCAILVGDGPAGGTSLRVVDVGPRPSVAEVERLVQRAQTQA